MGSELENGHGILRELVLKTGMGKVGISEGMHFLSVGTTDQGASMAAHGAGGWPAAAGCAKLQLALS